MPDPLATPAQQGSHRHRWPAPSHIESTGSHPAHAHVPPERGNQEHRAGPPVPTALLAAYYNQHSMAHAPEVDGQQCLDRP